MSNIIGERIQSERIKLGISQRALGDILGYSEVTVRFWETGRNLPKVYSIVDLCRVFHCTSDYLLGLSDKR